MKSRHIKWLWFLGLVAVATLVSGSPAFAQRYTTLTQYASGDGWSSDIFLTNQAAQAATGIVVYFYGNDGLPMTVEANIGTASSFTLNLNPGASQIIRMASTGSLKVGYVVVKAPTPGSVIVTEVFRYIQAGTVVAELGVPQLGRHHHYSFPVEINTAQGINTGLALANPTYDSSAAVAQTLIVNLTNSNGTFFGRALVPLGVGAHMAKYLNEAGLFPGLDNFTGLASVSGARNFGVLGLRQDRQAFGAVAVDYGAALPPFVMSSPILAEVEPNNSNTQAQYLAASCVINGYISTAGDLDYFSFDGRANDVVSFMINTQGLGSSLDSVLTLYRADGTQFATSDQNGLYGQDDSLIHVVLPADGRYYVKVSDYFNMGGANYGYQLHVVLPAGIAPAPAISSLNPTSAVQGSTTTLIIAGTNLSGTAAVTFNPSTGVNVSNIQSTATQVTAQITIAADAALGTRQVSVTTAGGTSNSLPFTINQGTGGGYDGTWTGTTSIGGVATITVVSNAITKINFSQMSIPCGCCTLTGFGQTFSTPKPIVNDSFSYTTSSSPGSWGATITLNFSGSQASGSVNGNLQGSSMNPCCAGTFSFTWNVTKGVTAQMQAAEEEMGAETNIVVDKDGNIVSTTTKK